MINTTLALVSCGSTSRIPGVPQGTCSPSWWGTLERRAAASWTPSPSPRPALTQSLASCCCRTPPPPPPLYPPPPRSRHTLNRPQGHRCCHPQTCHDYELYEIIFYRENGGIPVKEFLHQLHGGVVLVDQVLPVVVPVLRELATHATVDNL